MSKNTLVAYFSAEGNTASAAKILAKTLDADAFEIKPVAPYTAADLDWTNSKSRSSVEMADEQSRPAIAEKTDLSSYERVLIGFPVWWYVEPRIIDTFLESYDFTGKKIILFATSGGSGIEKSVARLKKLYPSLDIAGGKRITKSTAESWAKTL